MKLTDAQKEIVNYDQLGTLIVKGTAGSGKSLVGLHRINYFFNKRSTSLFAVDTPCKVLVITFNKVMYYQLEQNFKNVCTSNTKKEDVCFINIDKIIYKETKDFAKSCGYDVLTNNRVIKDNYIKLLNIKKDKFTDEFILDEFRWIRSNLLNKKQEYLEIKRLGRGKRRLNKEDREYIWRLLQNYRKNLKLERKIDYLDACILTLKRSELNIFSEYNHIIVDEAQDLSKLKLSFIVKLNNNNLTKLENSLMILYDSSQNVYDESWLGYGRSFSSIGLDIKGKTKKLEISYRTTRQIHQAANNLISYYKEQNIDKETELKPVFAGTEEGIKPITFNFKNKEDELKTISNLIEKLTKKMYTPKDIMVVAFTNNDLYEVKRFLNNQILDDNGKKKKIAYILDGDMVENNRAGYNKSNFLEKEYDISELQEECVKVLTVNNAKGLESKVVFIAGIESLSNMSNNGEKDENERNIRNAKRLYTAMTRAQELLFISEDDKYIGKIDDKYITKIDSYENLDIDSYLAADLETNSVFIETNKTNRYEKLIQEYKEQAEEYEKLKVKQDKEYEELKEKLRKENEKKIKEIEELKKEKEKLKETQNKKIEKLKKEQALKDEGLRKEKEKLKEAQDKEIEKLKKELALKDEELKKEKENNKLSLENIDEIIKIKEAALKKEVERDYGELAEKYVKMLSEAEVIHSSFERGSIGPNLVYVGYAKVLENIIKDFLNGLNQGYNIDKATLGPLIGHIRKYEELKSICKTLDSLSFVSIRNDATHKNIEDRKELEKLREYLINKKTILKLYRITQEKLNEKIDISIKVEKLGELMRGLGDEKTGTIRINSNDYYPYLIDNDDLAVHKKKIPKGTYLMKGHYTVSKGNKIFVIEEYKREKAM